MGHTIENNCNKANGDCMNTIGSFICNCTKGWAGPTCDQDLQVNTTTTKSLPIVPSVTGQIGSPGENGTNGQWTTLQIVMTSLCSSIAFVAISVFCGWVAIRR